MDRNSQQRPSFILGHGRYTWRMPIPSDMSSEEAERLVKTYLERFPGLKMWLDHTKSSLRE